MKRRARILGSLLLAGLATDVSGCVSGFAWQTARRRESVTRYSEAWSDGERLVLRYDVAMTDGKGAVLSHGARAAQLQLTDLAAVPEIPVDAMPLQELPVPPPLGPFDQAIPIFRQAGESDEAQPAASIGTPHPLQLRVRERDAAEGGLEIISASGRGWLDSDVLYRERLAWWLVPALPVAGALDVLILPFQILTVWPLFVFGD